MTIWDKHQIESKVLHILDIQPYESDHHFGRPFLTPYQIAIEFKRLYNPVFREIGKPVGGKNASRKDSLAQYIALELSRRIKAGHIQYIEGRFIDLRSLITLQYNDEGQSITSSMQRYDLSMYRRTD